MSSRVNKNHCRVELSEFCCFSINSLNHHTGTPSDETQTTLLRGISTSSFNLSVVVSAVPSKTSSNGFLQQAHLESWHTLSLYVCQCFHQWWHSGKDCCIFLTKVHLEKYCICNKNFMKFGTPLICHYLDNFIIVAPPGSGLTAVCPVPGYPALRVPRRAQAGRAYDLSHAFGLRLLLQDWGRRRTCTWKELESPVRLLNHTRKVYNPLGSLIPEEDARPSILSPLSS